MRIRALALAVAMPWVVPAEAQETASRRSEDTAGGVASASASPPPSLPGPWSVPPAELDQIAFLAGDWTCAGRGVGPHWEALVYESTWQGKWDLRKFWISVQYDQKKGKGNPYPFRGKGFVGWDASAKKFWIMGVDDWGGWVSLGSPGWDAAGTQLIFTGDMGGPMEKMVVRYTFSKERAGKRGGFTFKMEWLTQGTWTFLGEDVCTRWRDR